MKGHPWLSFVIHLTVCVMVSGAAEAVTPVVKSTCMISWDPSEDDTRITEYRITVWMVNGQRAPQKTTRVVKAPTTRVSCKEVGANKLGNWQATVQACLNDATCARRANPCRSKWPKNKPGQVDPWVLTSAFQPVPSVYKSQKSLRDPSVLV